MRHMLVSCAAVIALPLALGLTGCAPIEDPGPPAEETPPPTEEVAADPVAPPEEGPTGPDLRAFVWECEDGTRFVADLDPDSGELTLFLPERTVTLPPQEAASGARYGDGEVTFRPQGREATLEVGGARVACTEDRRQSVIESARLEGVEVWATGNEPGWMLEIYPQRIVFVTGYGEERVETTILDTEVDAEAAETVYTAETELHSLTAVVRGRDCVDSMSGEEFPLTVNVELDGQVFSGCGQRLR